MRRGFTLIEMLVVLVLLALAAGLVAPALFPRGNDPKAFATLVGLARDAAVRRGEVMYLRMERSGVWRITGEASAVSGHLAAGRMSLAPLDAAFTLVISPLGSCAFDVQSTAAARVLVLDPLTCEVGAS